MPAQHYTAVGRLCCRLVIILGLAAVIPVHAASLQDSQELIQLLGIAQRDIESLDHGKTVFFEVAEGNEKELSAGVAIYLPATPAKIMQFIKQKGLEAIDTDITARGAIPLQATPESFKRFGFKAGTDEAKNLLQAKPGSRFNLSTEEFKMLRDAGPSQPDAAVQAYRKILLQRFHEYRKSGLNGIASYDRGGGAEANPAGELRSAALADKVLARYFPALYQAWLNYPAALPAGADERFFWLNRKVEGRPTAILRHRIMLTAGVAEVILARQFYVGHSYNSNQLSIICLPYRDGSLLFYANRSFTDRVAGIGSSLKRSIGRERMQREIIKQLTRLHKAFK